MVTRNARRTMVRKHTAPKKTAPAKLAARTTRRRTPTPSVSKEQLAAGHTPQGPAAPLPTSSRSSLRLPKAGSVAKPAVGINLVRKDYLLDERVVIASARAKRPDQFRREPEAKTPAEHCPFCPRNQDKIIITDEVPAPGTQYGWAFRSVVNLFAAVTPEGEPPGPVMGGRLFEETHAYGHAEVVIDSPEHELELEQMDVDTIASLLRFLGRRVADLRSRKGIKYVSLFKNRGATAGASISHSHTQIIATSFIPGHVMELLEANFRKLTAMGKSPFVDIIEKERGGPRFVAEDDHVAVFTPFAAKLPFELWIVPKRQVASLTMMLQEELFALAAAIKRALLRLDELGMPAFNMLFIGDNDYGELRFHVRILPRINVQAGFELGTGTIINPVPPETAAAFYRRESAEEGPQ